MELGGGGKGGGRRYLTALALWPKDCEPYICVRACMCDTLEDSVGCFLETCRFEVSSVHINCSHCVRG
jgi:hypothetical protein